jgi:hypothetical protein
MFASIVLPEVRVGVPFRLPVANEAFPQVIAPLTIEVELPPVRIGVMVVVVDPPRAKHRIAVMVSVAPVAL